MLVGVAAFRLRCEIRARTAIVALAVFASALVLGFFAVDTLRHDPGTFVAIAVMLALAVILDLLWKRARSGRPQRRREAGPV